MAFKHFLLNEEKSYLGQRISDILTALHDLQEDIENLGSRHINRMAESIVNQIRRVLHSNWSDKQHKSLKSLQKSGVAIMKAIEEKGDIKAVLASATKEIEELSGKLGRPVSDIGDSAEGEPAVLDPPEEPQPEQPPQQPPAGEQPGQMPGATQPPNMPMPGQGIQGVA
tara:strand:+ start:401 stop:907 length:507 start_codon:yes stop_codon:yes gene_type:complete